MFILEGNGTSYYTRAGNFYLDDNDRIVNANGYYLQSMDGGYITIPEDAKSFDISSDGTVTYIAEMGLTKLPVKLLWQISPTQAD